MASLWNTLMGGASRNSQRQQPAEGHQGQQQQPMSSTFAAPPPPSPSSSSASASAGSSTRFDYTPQSVESMLHSSAFADPSQLHPLAGLNRETLEYLSLDDTALSGGAGHSVIPSRGLSDDLCYGAGVTYLTALSLGGAWGLREGLVRSTAQAPKLRLNSVLNAMTRRGPFLANSAGVVAIIYNLISWTISKARGKHDAANTIAAGALSGMLFKSTGGGRTMLISGGIVGSVAGAWAITRQLLLPAPETREPSPAATSELS